jgi:hypothetical protein
MGYISSADTSRFCAYHLLPLTRDLLKYSTHPSEPFQISSIDRDEKHFSVVFCGRSFDGCCVDGSRMPNVKQQNAFCLCVKIFS